MRILLIEDERKVASFVARALREESYAVDISDTGPDGLERALGTSYDAILLDIRLPGLSGIEVCSELREKGIECRFVGGRARQHEREVLHRQGTGRRAVIVFRERHRMDVAAQRGKARRVHRLRDERRALLRLCGVSSAEYKKTYECEQERSADAAITRIHRRAAPKGAASAREE